MVPKIFGIPYDKSMMFFKKMLRNYDMCMAHGRNDKLEIRRGRIAFKKQQKWAENR